MPTARQLATFDGFLFFFSCIAAALQTVGHKHVCRHPLFQNIAMASAGLSRIRKAPISVVRCSCVLICDTSVIGVTWVLVLCVGLGCLDSQTENAAARIKELLGRKPEYVRGMRC